MTTRSITPPPAQDADALDQPHAGASIHSGAAQDDDALDQVHVRREPICATLNGEIAIFRVNGKPAAHLFM
jgi:hypothetical protein